MKTGNEPAFPHYVKYHGDFVQKISDNGLTKREYFAAMAMQSIISTFSNIEVMEAIALQGQREGFETIEDAIGNMAKRQADALIKELEE